MLARPGAEIILVCLLCIISIRSHYAFDNENNDDDFHHDDQDHETTTGHHHEANSKHAPKDRILLRDVKTLIFTRNKRTTSRRTHSIHQLSCVGGTAGCKLFTPDTVECENVGFDKDKKRHDWKCHADISDRVQFNHVDVICEGYDYPEDDYILVGSCGLEFTLDYTDPHDYHHQSYFKHMDDHEKEMHHERVRATAKPKQSKSPTIQSVINQITDNLILCGAFVVLIVSSLILVRYISSRNGAITAGKNNKPIRGYGPLTSAVMTTKKAC